jgi:sulfate transport system substrate-binding protein
MDVKTSHAGSILQTEALIKGLVADTVCLSSAEEIDQLNSDKHIVAPDWREHFPYHCSPFYTTAVMLVRKEKKPDIHDWEDLFSNDVLVALPSPAISGLGRHAYLTLLANRLSTSPQEAQQDVTKLMLKAHLYGLGAYQSFYCFHNDCKADVFITWENEAIRIVEREPQTYEIIYPTKGIIAEPTVAILHKYTQKRETTEQARAYLNYLFSKEGQLIAENNGLRPRIPNGIRNFPEIELKTITEIFGSQKETYQQHFFPNGTFQQILKIRDAHIGGVE